MKGSDMVGVIYKNRRFHPSSVFVVTRTRKVGGKTVRVYGTQVADEQPPTEENYLFRQFQDLYPFVLWAPSA